MGSNRQAGVDIRTVDALVARPRGNLVGGEQPVIAAVTGVGDKLPLEERRWGRRPRTFLSKAGVMMFKPALFVAVLAALSSARAQDIVGLEDCAQARGTDKKVGCLQANVEFLHGLLKRNDAVAQAKLRAEAAQIAAVTAKLEEMRLELTRLKSAVDLLDQKVPKK